MHDDRSTYIDVIKHLLFKMEETPASEPGPSDGNTDPTWNGTGSPPPTTTNGVEMQVKTKKPKRAKEKTSNEISKVPSKDSSTQETKARICQRLKEGSKVEIASGPHFAGTIETPVRSNKTAPLADHEIDSLLEDISEIKLLLFCRLLLSHASALTADIRANSVDEFLNDPGVTDSDLRELALKMDNPGFQEIRDACADLRRGEESVDEVNVQSEEDEDTNDDDEIIADQELYLCSYQTQ